MQRRGFIAALTALAIGGTAGKLLGATREHEHAATAQAIFGGRDWKLASGGPMPKGQWVLVGERGAEVLRPSPPRKVGGIGGGGSDLLIEWTR